jgi:hypothetical protein
MIVSRKSILATLLPAAILAGCAYLSRPDQPKPPVRTEMEASPEAEKYSGSAFSEHVRTTEPQSPEEEMAGFKLPPASRSNSLPPNRRSANPSTWPSTPRGRLWVTESFEYPFRG